MYSKFYISQHIRCFFSWKLWNYYYASNAAIVQISRPFKLGSLNYPIILFSATSSITAIVCVLNLLTVVFLRVISHHPLFLIFISDLLNQTFFSYWLIAGIVLIFFWQVMAFFLRPMLSVGLLCVGLWPVIMYTMQGTVERSMRLVWIGACVLLASFTYMPVVGREAYYPMV